MKIQRCYCLLAVLGFVFCWSPAPATAEPWKVNISQNDRQIKIETPELEAVVNKKGYVSGISRQTFLDKKTGTRDQGFGLDIADWIMEPGSDAAYRDALPNELKYSYNNPYHGKQAKRSIEGPQICTKARELSPEIIRGKDFVAVRMTYTYKLAAPGKKIGSRWTQTIVFPKGKRYFISSQRIDAVNDSPAMFLRIDMPGHIRHKRGDTFSKIYLSYLEQTNSPKLGSDGLVLPEVFFENFAPDEKLNYRRQRVAKLPQRFIRAYQIRDPQSGAGGPWLAGMTLDASMVHEAWCHQRGYVCMIEEFGGRPIEAGQAFSAAFVVGYFDSIDEMHRVYDQYKGYNGLTVDQDGWQLTK